MGIVLPWVIFGWYFISRGALEPLLKHLGEYAHASVREGFDVNKLCGDSESLACVFLWLLRFNRILLPLLVFGVAGFVLNLKRRDSLWWLGGFWVLGMWLAIKGAGWKDWSHYYVLVIPGLVIGVEMLVEFLEKVSVNRARVVSIFLMLFVFSLR